MFHNFRRTYFVSQYRNISERNPSVCCFRKFSAEKKFMDKSGGKRGGEVKRFPSKIFFSQFQKIKSWNPSLFQKVSGIEKF